MTTDYIPPKDPADALIQLEQELGLPSGFYMDLLREDDWSFVIKLNALFEAASAHVLMARLNSPTIEEEISQLDFAEKRYGKVQLLRKLGAIEAHQATTLYELATLRNLLVHNVKNVRFSLETWSKSWDANQAKKYIGAFGHEVADPIPFGDKRVPAATFARQNVKIAIWLTCAELLACLHVDKSSQPTVRLTEALKTVMQMMQDSGQLTLSSTPIDWSLNEPRSASDAAE
jgi:hypothetical protein